MPRGRKKKEQPVVEEPEETSEEISED